MKTEILKLAKAIEKNNEITEQLLMQQAQGHYVPVGGQIISTRVRS